MGQVEHGIISKTQSKCFKGRKLSLQSLSPTKKESKGHSSIINSNEPLIVNWSFSQQTQVMFSLTEIYDGAKV